MQTILFLSLFVFLIASFVCFTAFKRYQSKTRINSYRDRSAQIIHPNKIIVAVDPQHLFVQVQKIRKSGFSQLEVERKGMDKYLYKLQKIFGYGLIYYKTRDKKQNIEFIKQLLSTNKVELYLYTFLSEQVSESILKRLGLGEFFKRSHRLFCNQSLKHPTDIDSNTKRVIILTGSKQDFQDEDYKYFLVVKRNELKKYGKELSELITRNEDIDDLHNEFVRWRINEFGDSSHQ